ncbi:MAG: DUF2752 domain-containing protein [Lachnospira sp.]|nr:DUF2752 domain-containing protein [Lachnospira sp.]MDD5828973.1 DUF2752 domain-containing protein [Lachnospira sp.]
MFNKEQIKKYLYLIISAGLLCLFLYLTNIGCPIKFITGISCPGCGMTRALFSLLRLDVKSAVYYHPLVFVMPVIVIIILLRNKLGRRLFKIFTVFFIVLFIAVYICRMADAGNSIVQINVRNGLIGRILGHFIVLK